MLSAAVLASLLVVVLQPRIVIRLLARAFPRIVWRVETAEPIVALTFDDGPDPTYTPQVLEILHRHGVRATFFLIGERAARQPELVRRIREARHEIGNHGQTEGTVLYMPTRRFEEHLLQAEAILGLGAVSPKLYRPGGGLIRPTQHALVAHHGYTIVLGSAYAYDPYRPPTAYIRWAIVKNLEPGAIVVLHDSGGNRSHTISALEGILAAARARGLRFVTISELLAAGKTRSDFSTTAP